MNTTIFYFFTYVVEAIILWQYCSCIFLPKHGFQHEIALLFPSYFTLFLISLQHNFIYNIIAFLLINFIFIVFMYHAKYMSALFHAFISTVFMGMSELAVLAIISRFSGSFYDNLNYFRNVVILSVSSKLFYFLLIHLITHLYKYRNAQYYDIDNSIFLLSLIPLSSIVIMATLYIFCLLPEPSLQLDWLISISAILLLLINIFIFWIYSYNQKKQHQFTELQLQLQKENDDANYYRLLFEQDENQKILIHDIKNHFNSILTLLEKEKYDEIRNYITHVSQSTSLKETYHICDNEFLNTILCRYSQLAAEQHTTFKVDIRKNSTLFLTPNDLTSLFCNLLDNALEATVNIPNSFIELSVTEKPDISLSVLTLVNSCLENPFSDSKHILVTTKADKQIHGFGTKSISRVTKKYKGHLQNYYDEGTKTFHTVIAFKI